MPKNTSHSFDIPSDTVGYILPISKTTTFTTWRRRERWVGNRFGRAVWPQIPLSLFHSRHKQTRRGRNVVVVVGGVMNARTNTTGVCVCGCL